MFFATCGWGGTVFSKLNQSAYDKCKTDAATSSSTAHADLFKVTTAMAWICVVAPTLILLVYIFMLLRYCGCITFCGGSGKKESAPAAHEYAPVSSKEQP